MSGAAQVPNRMSSLRRESSWREVDYGNETPQETDLLKEVLKGLMDFDAPLKNVGGQALLIKNVGRELQLETKLADDSLLADAVRSAVKEYREHRAVKQVFAWPDGEWLHLRAIVEPWSREVRRRVYASERRIASTAPDCEMYFEVSPRNRTADLPDDAKLVFAREPASSKRP